MSKLERNLVKHISRANRRFSLIEENDRIMVAVSGGKDSWGLLSLLRAYRKLVPFSFELVAVTLDQGQPGFDGDALEAYYKDQGYEYRVVYRDTYSVVLDKTPEGKSFCALCSRMRRGILYTQAKSLGANKIALGHHRDDLIETLLLNQFYSGRIRSMAPRLPDSGDGPMIIRPMVTIPETSLIEYARDNQFPIIPCNLCGSQENLKRKEVKTLLQQLEQTNPRVRGNLLASLSNIEPSHLLGHVQADQEQTLVQIEDAAADQV